MTKVRRTNLPPGQSAVMDLKAGEVSQLINDSGVHYIYKMVSKEVPPLDQVTDEIHSTLQGQRVKDLMQKVQSASSTELNEAYFGPATAAPPAPGSPLPGMAKPRMVTAPTGQPANAPPPQPH